MEIFCDNCGEKMILIQTDFLNNKVNKYYNCICGNGIKIKEKSSNTIENFFFKINGKGLLYHAKYIVDDIYKVRWADGFKVYYRYFSKDDLERYLNKGLWVMVDGDNNE